MTKPITQGEWAEILALMLDSPAFHQAYRQVGEAGVGSAENAERVARLLASSEPHREKLELTAEDILRHAERYLKRDPSDDDLVAFADEILNELLVIAVAYFIIGAGVGSVTALIAEGLIRAEAVN